MNMYFIGYAEAAYIKAQKHVKLKNYKNTQCSKKKTHKTCKQSEQIISTYLTYNLLELQLQ